MFLWFHVSPAGRFNGRAPTALEAERAAIAAGRSHYGATIRVVNVSGIQVTLKRFQFGTVEGNHVLGWFPSKE